MTVRAIKAYKVIIIIVTLMVIILQTFSVSISLLTVSYSSGRNMLDIFKDYSVWLYLIPSLSVSVYCIDALSRIVEDL